MIISLSPAQAQSVNFGGTTFNNDIIGWYDLYNLSFTSHNYGTARSMAMGNAFTALGADMVSTSLNPAGIGMYVDSDVSFTPMMQFTKSPTKGGDPTMRMCQRGRRPSTTTPSVWQWEVWAAYSLCIRVLAQSLT